MSRPKTPPHSRIYWEVMDDPKFDGVRDDMRLMGAWVSLLLVADRAFPQTAYIPSVVPMSAFRKLVAAALVDELPGHRYQIHGLPAERARRSAIGLPGASGRWSDRDAIA